MLKKLCLIATLQAITFAFFVPFPIIVPIDSTTEHYPYLDNIENIDNIENTKNANHFETSNFKICPFIEYADIALCNSTKTSNNIKVKNEIKVKEFKNNVENSKGMKNKNNFIELDLELDPKDLCPLLELIDKSFCKSSKDIKIKSNISNDEMNDETKIDPKDLCPLLELIETKLCS